MVGGNVNFQGKLSTIEGLYLAPAYHQRRNPQHKRSRPQR